jgi:minimal PKS ketosynthase (KS/KS alpha)
MRRTAVTGIGVVAPGGSTREAFWGSITAGRTATGRITFFDPSGFRSQIAAECDFDPVAAGLDGEEIGRMDRLALATPVPDDGKEAKSLDKACDLRYVAIKTRAVYQRGPKDAPRDAATIA